jgi:hypothetical protein
MPMIKIVTNHWGWSPRGIWMWLRYGWGVATWGVEITGSFPIRFRRRVKLGPLCFAWGSFPARQVPHA